MKEVTTFVLSLIAPSTCAKSVASMYVVSIPSLDTTSLNCLWVPIINNRGQNRERKRGGGIKDVGSIYVRVFHMTKYPQTTERKSL